MELQEKINILKSLGVYDKFVYNCLNHHFVWYNISSLSDVYCYLEEREYIVSMLFGFSTSPEGYCYWNKINKMYKKLYNKKKYYGITGKD